MPQSHLQAFKRRMSKVPFRREFFAIDQWRWKLGQHGLAQLQRDVAAPGNLHRICQCRGQIGKQRLHLFARFEVLFRRKAAHPALIGEDFTVRDTDPCLMRFVFVLGCKLDRVGRHHRQAQACRQLHGRSHMGFVICTTCALQFNVKPMRKNRCQAQRQICRPRAITLQQGCTQRPSLRARQGNQALAQLLQPSQAAHRLRLHHVLGPGTAQYLAQVQIALVALHQQQYPGANPLFGSGIQRLQHQLGANQWLYPLAAGGFVKLDSAKQVVQVCDRQRRLLEFGCQGHRIINAVGAINHRKLGVKAQVGISGCGGKPRLGVRNGHSPHCRKAKTSKRSAVPAPQSGTPGCTESPPQMRSRPSVPKVKRTRPSRQRQNSTHAARH